jgi:transposase InsO family protein
LALHLRWNEKKVRRIRNLAGIVIVRASKKHKYGKASQAEIPAPDNALKSFASFKDEARPQDGLSYTGMTDSGGWVQDFTYLWFERSFHYLAVVVDLKTRQVMGWQLGLRHTSELTYTAVLDALSKHSAPSILHSDQGSEYLSYKHQVLCERMEIILSCSARASPWQNGFMERFFGTIKLELGPLGQYRDAPHLYEAIALAIYYYNTKRIHTALKTSPAAYAASLMIERDKVLQKMGG